MEVFLQAVTALGDRVAQRYAQAGNDAVSLPAIAAGELEHMDSGFRFDPQAIARYLAESEVQQNAWIKFSDLPVTLYRGDGFYIELLTWSRSTTSIHAHGFSGAYRVMQGSSLHTGHQFTVARQVDAACQLGVLIATGSEVLTEGSVRRIEPGPDGSVHSLYHLDNPSLTLVVRTDGLPEFQPQYMYYPPGLALDPFALAADARVEMMRRLLAVTRRTQPDAVANLWIRQVSALPFSSVAWLCLQQMGELEQVGLEEVLAAVAVHHGDLATSLREAVAAESRVHLLSRARALVRDSDLRFFIALLMNVHDRAALLAAIATRYPQDDPVTRCAALLAALGRGRADTEALVTQALAAADVGALDVGRRLGAAAPDGDAEYFTRLLAGDLPEAEVAPIEAIPELSVLFR